MAPRFPDYDLYDVLRVKSSASADEIKKAHRTLCMETHPDKVGNTARNNENFAKVQDAYEILRDPALRQEYDYHRNRNRQYHNGFPGPQYNDQGANNNGEPKLPPWVEVFIQETESRFVNISSTLFDLERDLQTIWPYFVYVTSVYSVDETFWRGLWAGSVSAVNAAKERRDLIQVEIAKIKQGGSFDFARKLPEATGALYTKAFHMRCAMAHLRELFPRLRTSIDISSRTDLLISIEAMFTLLSR
ncbi:DnaJ domain-containing protein [Whalleya microplaca]|nr:DnaJ domain-containing protein [Whalleya microplaca]